MLRIAFLAAALAASVVAVACGANGAPPTVDVEGAGTAVPAGAAASAERRARVLEPTAAPTPLPPRILPAPWSQGPASDGAVAPEVSALAAVVLDEASGEVLYEKAADTPLAPASLTKIATAIIALEHGALDDVVAVDVDSRIMRGSTVMGLVPGDRFPLRDLLYGMMLPSGNDAALAIGRHLAGSDAAFVAWMNGLARRLGLRHTRFANPHGLGARGHETSARDLALLSRYAMSMPEFRNIVAAWNWTARGSRTIPLYNINSFLAYPGADGLKTGYTRRAGPTLAASAQRDGHRVFVVLLNAPSRDSDAVALMDWAFRSFRWPA